MNHTIFSVSLLLSTAALCLVVLSTFYGWVKAYLAISWIPVTLYLIIYMFLSLSYQPSFHTANLNLMLKAVGWASLVQGLVGVVITLGSVIKKEDWVVPGIATLLAVLPFLLV